MATESCNNETDEHTKSEVTSLSKRQLKKAEKRRVWIESKAERRKEEKERRKRKMERMREERTFTESRSATRKRLKREQVLMRDSECKVGIVFDMQFSSLMHQRDLGKCIKQMLRCYSENRRLKAPLQMHISSLAGEALTEMEKHDGYRVWDIHFYEDNFVNNLPKESLVYLSGDSENVLQNLEQNKNYIIGGLVDHNNHKGICLQKAQELGISHARLPIDKYVCMKTRHILAVNHVYEIMVQVTLGKTWRDAFFHVIPGRKGIGVISQENQASEEANEVTSEENRAILEGNRVTSEENQVTAEGNQVTAEENQVTSKENQVTSLENKVNSEENQFTAKDNQVTPKENQVTAEENQVSAEKN